MVSGWNYQVIAEPQRDAPNGTTFRIVEAYHRNGEYHGYCTPFAACDTRDELVEMLRLMLAAAEQGATLVPADFQ